MARDSRRSRSPDRNRRSHRSRSPPRRRSPSPSRHRSSNRRYDRNEDRSPPRRRSHERSQRTTRPAQERQHQPRDHERVRSPTNVTDHANGASNRAQSPSLPPPSKDNEAVDVADEALQQMTEEEQMNALLGFGGFSTTKGKAVAGNNIGAANIKKQRKFRQYMNRKGGFNRLLDK
ncbi:hypothetical protein GGF42_005672 [Coemansia sp. RSA 2424]|nr:hypothetical protein GGF42_005672 [Coemansia sp. RSA 2424]